MDVRSSSDSGSDSDSSYSSDVMIEIEFEDSSSQEESTYHTSHFMPGLRTAIAKAISGPPRLTSYLMSILPSAKTVITTVTSIMTSIPISVYAFALPLNVNPESLTLEIWTSLPASIKIIAITFTAISLGIGTLMRCKHIPSIAKKLQEMTRSYCKDISTFLKNNFILMMATLAAMSSLALGYYGFLWGGQTLAIGAAVINFLMTFGFRIEAMSKLINKIRNMLDEDQQFQTDLINELKRIHPEHINSFEVYLKEEMKAGKSINEEIVFNCLKKMYDKTEYIDLSNSSTHIQLFHPPCTMDTIQHYLKKSVDLSLGAFIAGVALLFYTQYGYDGIKILFQLATGYTGTENWPHSAKISLGLLASASSVVLGFLAGLDITNGIIIAFDYMKNSPANKIKVITLSMAGVISATTFAGAASVMTNKLNLFNIKPKSFPAYVLIGGNWLFATAFDTNAILKLLTKNQATYTHAMNWLENNTLSKNKISALRQHSYFKNKNIELQRIIEEDRKLSLRYT